jgi:energy-coupling factor transporter transmembrane protein EcfT
LSLLCVILSAICQSIPKVPVLYLYFSCFAILVSFQFKITGVNTPSTLYIYVPGYIIVLLDFWKLCCSNTSSPHKKVLQTEGGHRLCYIYSRCTVHAWSFSSDQWRL